MRQLEIANQLIISGDEVRFLDYFELRSFDPPITVDAGTQAEVLDIYKHPFKDFHYIILDFYSCDKVDEVVDFDSDLMRDCLLSDKIEVIQN